MEKFGKNEVTVSMAELTPVSSSQIAKVGYNVETATLTIQFKRKGSVYEYSEVPEIIYANMLNASSVGKYFHEHVKGKYVYRQLLEEK